MKHRACARDKSTPTPGPLKKKKNKTKTLSWIKKKREEGKRRINVSDCHGFRLKRPSGRSLLHINLRIICSWLYFMDGRRSVWQRLLRWDEAALWGQANPRHMCSVIHRLGPIWTRPGGPIQTTSLCSRAPGPLKQSETLFIYCRPAFGPAPRHTLTQPGEAVETCIQEWKEWAAASLSSAGPVSVGFIISSTYWHLHLVAPLNHACFPARTSCTTPSFSFELRLSFIDQ